IAERLQREIQRQIDLIEDAVRGGATLSAGGKAV
ncbi:hypothetical protein PSYMO_38373, partial [Pseudomonas amygdali pv. mori str. 301020]